MDTHMFDTLKEGPLIRKELIHRFSRIREKPFK